MVKKQTGKKPAGTTYGEAKYPYTPTPNALRKFLDIVPSKPKPVKVVGETLKAWGLKNTNDSSILRVLKELEFLTSAGEPTEHYVGFMTTGKGPAVLGQQMKKVYGELFSTISNPATASHEELKNFFNVFGGGAEKVTKLQIQTFKALLEHATFGALDPLEAPNTASDAALQNPQGGDIPAIRIDLHIHLPENKSRTDYEAIIESIATHLYQKKP